VVIHTLVFPTCTIIPYFSHTILLYCPHPLPYACAALPHALRMPNTRLPHTLHMRYLIPFFRWPFHFRALLLRRVIKLACLSILARTEPQVVLAFHLPGAYGQWDESTTVRGSTVSEASVSAPTEGPTRHMLL
jgi:hypothetical protein